MEKNKVISQSEFIRKYNEKNREEFNEYLFRREDNDIIEEIKKVILSCERSKYFIIKVNKFTVIEDYDEINKLLKEQERFKSRSKSKKIDNKYNYLTLKDSDIKLLIVDYFIKVNNTDDPEKISKNLRVLIEIPRIVNKYYFRIFGNIYSSMYQVVDGSTYNNSQSNSKSQNVTLKTMFMATRVNRYQENIRCTDGVTRKCIFYSSIIFKKSVPVMKYLLAKYGLYELQQIIKVPGLIITDTDPKDSEYYTAKKSNLFISLPKYIYDNDVTAQSLMYTVILSINKNSNISNIFTKEYWVKVLGGDYGSPTILKGDSILDSLESILDISTRESIMLPEEDKQDIFRILIWMIRQFSELRQKDNLDISTKRLRYAEYIAALYAMKLSRGLYRIADEGANVQLSSIEKAIYTFPDYILKTITKDRLVNYKNYVNDLDALAALKFTYKGVSGLGEKGSSIPAAYRQVHPSHLKRLDLDSSSASDPGLSGHICPLTDIYNDSFSNYQEPNNWRDETDKMLSDYRDMIGLKQVIEFKRQTGLPYDEIKEGIIDESLNVMKKLISPIIYLENNSMLEP